MVGLDTNVLVRHVAEDDPQATDVSQYLADQLSIARPGFVSLVVLCELVWVLRRAYGCDKARIDRTVTGLLMADVFEIERPTLVWRALEAYRNGTAIFRIT